MKHLPLELAALQVNISLIYRIFGLHTDASLVGRTLIRNRESHDGVFAKGQLRGGRGFTGCLKRDIILSFEN